MEDKFSNNIKNQNYGFMSKIRNSYNQYNRNNNNKKHNIYLNSFNKKFPNNILKDINNSYDSLYNNINSFFPNNIISRTNKKNIINLIVNPNEQNYNINKTTNLENYVNFRIKTGERKNKDKINLTDNMFDNIYRDSYQKINNINDKNFKYKKKIININNLIRKNDNKHYQSTLKYSIPFSNYKAHIIPVNKYQEQDNTNNKSMYFKENKNNINNSYRLKKIERPNTQRNANSSRTKNIKDKSNDIENYHSFFHLSNLYNNNKRINVDLNPKFKSKRIDNNNSLEKNKLSFPNLKFFPLISKNNNYSKKIKINKNINMINSTFDKNNHSSLKLKDISNIIYTNNNSFLNIKNEMSKENINKSNIIKLEDYKSKKNKDFTNNNNKKVKRINLNKLLNNRKNSPKIIIKSSKEKKIFTEHFSTEGNKNIINSYNLSAIIKNDLNQNNKKDKNINIEQNKKLITKEYKNNINLYELMEKLRKTKNKNEKNKNSNKNKIIKGNILNKKTNNTINNLNNQKNIKINLKKNTILAKLKLNKPLKKLETTKNKENNENNKYMEQSLKLSEYIKEYHLKNNNYPETNLNFYRIGRLIGQGGFAKVNLGLNILTGRVVAIKSFNKTIKTKNGNKINMNKILYEINLMRKLNHQNITKILETFEDEQFYFIIMEYINGGNLLSYVKKRRKLSEKVAKFIFRQIILGIKHIHSKLIVHRDIKLENILIDMNNNIKICDFGIGIILSSENQTLHGICGTPMYIAPEIILSTKEKGYLGFPVDIWSAGITLYIMVSGRLPFNLNESNDNIDDINKNNENKEKNKRLKYEIVNKEPKYIENISDDLRDLLKGLLDKDPNKRLNCEQILNHPWLNDIDSYKVKLFSKAEKNRLKTTFIDYRKSKLEDLIENFTLSNLFNDKINSDNQYNCETRSELLDPFNSINYEYFNLQNSKNIKKENEIKFNDFMNKKLIIENDILCFSNKAKELNFEYEIDNNKEVDKGVFINNKSNTESNLSNLSNSAKRNFYMDINISLEDENDEMSSIKGEKAERILLQIEKFGYDRDYVIRSIKNNYLNHVRVLYFLLMNYEKI